MYEYIKGTVAEVAPAYAVIDAGGVGYYLHISLETYAAVEHASEARLYVHYVVREDAQLLYGFSTKIERELFRLLISVSGVGGNTARMILSTYSPRESAPRPEPAAVRASRRAGPFRRRRGRSPA